MYLYHTLDTFQALLLSDQVSEVSKDKEFHVSVPYLRYISKVSSLTLIISHIVRPGRVSKVELYLFHTYFCPSLSIGKRLSLWITYFAVWRSRPHTRHTYFKSHSRKGIFVTLKRNYFSLFHKPIQVLNNLD